MLRFPATLLSLIFLHLELWPVSAAKAKGGRRPHPQYTMDADNNIVNNYNDRYTVNLTVAGTSVNVMLDTGSTDMWVAPVSGISGSFKDTGAPAIISYGDGSNFVNGTVGLAVVEFAGFTITDQAFINVTNSVGEESDVANGIFGLVGLGFHGPTGSIPSSLSKGGYNGTEVGKDVLSRIYDQNSDKGRFFAFSLSRVGDIEESADASLVIGEFDEKYAAVGQSPLLPQYPVDSGRWSVLTEGVSMGGVSIPWPSYSNDTPTGKNVVLFDTGTTNFLMPAEIRDAIYSAVPGAVLARNSSIPNTKFSEDQDTWVVPCTTAVNFTVKFAGQEFPIHPLDITDLSVLVGPDGKNYTVCTGSITNGGSILGPGGDDALYGDSFLRNVYSVFSFGNDTTEPHVQLLSQTDAADAAADFANVRADILDDNPPELSPREIIKLFDGSSSSPSVSASVSDISTPTVSASSTPTFAADSSDSSPTVTITVSGTPTGALGSAPSCTPIANSDALASSGKASVNLADNDVSGSTDSTVSKYGPVIIGLLAANLVILLLLVFLGIMSYVRSGRKAGPTRAVNPTYAPVKLKEDASRGSFEHNHMAYSD